MTSTWQVSAMIYRHIPTSTFPDPLSSQACAPGRCKKALFWKTNRQPYPCGPAAVSQFVSLSVGRSPWLLFARLSNTCSCQIPVVFVTCLLCTDSLGDLALGSQWQQQWRRGWQSIRSSQDNTGVCNLISFSPLPVFSLGFLLREMGERYRREMLAHGGAQEPMLMVEGMSNLFVRNIEEKFSFLLTNIWSTSGLYL